MDFEDVSNDIAAIIANIPLGDDAQVHPILESNLKEMFRAIWNAAWMISPREDNITALRASLQKLADAEALYRDYEQFRVASHQQGPKAWDAMRAAGDAARTLLKQKNKTPTFQEWLTDLDAEFVKAGWMAAGDSYVEQTGEACWRDFYDDDYTPKQAQQEEASNL